MRRPALALAFVAAALVSACGTAPTGPSEPAGFRDVAPAFTGTTPVDTTKKSGVILPQG